MKESSSSFPPEFIAHRVVPSLVSAIEFGGASASGIVPLVVQFGTNVAPDDYPTVVLAPIIKLYTSTDRATRIVLLDNLPQYADKLDKKGVVDKIWPHLVSADATKRNNFAKSNASEQGLVTQCRSFVKQP